MLASQGADWPTAFKRSIGVALKDQDDLVYLDDRLDAIIQGAAA